MNDLRGKTISRVTDERYDGLLLRFTDGTAVMVTGTGYETKGAQMGKVLAPHELRAMSALAQGERERERLARLQRAAKAAERAEMKATLTPAEFDAWERQRLGPLGLALREAYAADFQDFRRDANRLFWRGDHVH